MLILIIMCLNLVFTIHFWCKEKHDQFIIQSLHFSKWSYGETNLVMSLTSWCQLIAERSLYHVIIIILVLILAEIYWIFSWDKGKILTFPDFEAHYPDFSWLFQKLLFFLTWYLSILTFPDCRHPELTQLLAKPLLASKNFKT